MDKSHILILVTVAHICTHIHTHTLTHTHTHTHTHTGFLDVVFDGLGEGEVDDRADVGLVDPEAEGDGCVCVCLYFSGGEECECVRMNMCGLA